MIWALTDIVCTPETIGALIATFPSVEHFEFHEFSIIVDGPDLLGADGGVVALNASEGTAFKGKRNIV